MPCHDERDEPRYQPGSAGMSQAEAERLNERLKLATKVACAAGRLLHRTNMLKLLPGYAVSWMAEHATNDLEKGNPWPSVADDAPARSTRVVSGPFSFTVWTDGDSQPHVRIAKIQTIAEWEKEQNGTKKEG